MKNSRKLEENEQHKKTPEASNGDDRRASERAEFEQHENHHRQAMMMLKERVSELKNERIKNYQRHGLYLTLRSQEHLGRSRKAKDRINMNSRKSVRWSAVPIAPI